MRALEASGAVSAVVLPDTNEAIAKAVLHAAATIALGPGNKHDRDQLGAFHPLWYRGPL